MCSGAREPEQVYSYLADMNLHQRFLPPAFSDFKIEQGGVGAGTVTSFKVTAGGRKSGGTVRNHAGVGGGTAPKDPRLLSAEFSLVSGGAR